MTALALFDLDNTLFDRQGAFERWARAFVDGRKFPGDAYELLIRLDDDGFATRDAVFSGLRRAFHVDEPIASLIAGYRETYPKCFSPDADVQSALRRLRELGWRTGVVTNGPASQRQKLERAGLVELLDGWCISDEVGAAKPDRQIFDEAVRRCSPAEGVDAVWMVGDTAEPDIAGGLSAGMRTVWMHRHRTWEVAGYRPDAQAGTIAEAVALLLDGPPLSV